MSINEEKLRAWIEQTDKKLAHLEENQLAILDGDFCATNIKPKEPRIEHEDSRKAVWYWSSANQVDRVRCVKESRGLGTEITRFCAEEYHSCPDIEFKLLDADVEDDEIYTIAELCGEEEECGN